MRATHHVQIMVPEKLMDFQIHSNPLYIELTERRSEGMILLTRLDTNEATLGLALGLPPVYCQDSKKIDVHL